MIEARVETWRVLQEFFLVVRLELKTLWIGLLAIFIAGSLRAQDITGNWQGTVTSPQGRPARMILQITHENNEALKARIYSIDQGFVGDWVDSITVHDWTSMIGTESSVRIITDRKQYSL